jgi:hypothetical protein
MSHSQLLTDRDSIRITATEAGKGQYFIVVSCNSESNGLTAGAVYDTIGDFLHWKEAEIVHERIFGELASEPEITSARDKALRARGIACDGPVTFIQGMPVSGEGLAGIIIRAVAPVEKSDFVEVISENGVPAGRRWRRKGLKFILLQNMRNEVGESCPKTGFQAKIAIENADRILRGCGTDFRDVIRTWFYIRDILQWYGEFNR